VTKFCFVFSLLFPLTLLAQPGLQWIQTYDAERQEIFTDVFLAANGDFAACGYSKDRWVYPDTTQDMWMARIAPDGEEIWSRNFGSVGVADYANTLIESDSSDFIIGGSAGADTRAVRISDDGELIWSRSYGRNGELTAVIELKSGLFLFCGKSERQGYLLCINNQGDVNWQHTYSIAARSHYLTGLRETEGGYVVCGYAYFEDFAPHWRGWVLKVDENGDEIWSRTITPEPCQMFHGIVSTPNGFRIAGRFWTGDGRQDEDTGIIDITPNGNLDGYERIDVNGNDYPSALVRLPHGKTALVGMSYSSQQYQTPFVLVVNENRSADWSRVYSEEFRPANGFEMIGNGLSSVVWTPNSELIGGGYAMPVNNNPNRDGMLMKLEPLFLDPQWLYWEPHDTMLTVLQYDTVNFLVRADFHHPDSLGYTWFRNDSLFARDTAVAVVFDSLRQELIECLANAEGFTIAIRWHVSVEQLFIRDYAPNELNLEFRRGTALPCSLMTAAVEGAPVNFQWTLTDLDNFTSEVVAVDSAALIPLPRAGRFALEGLAWRGAISDRVVWELTVRSMVVNYWPEDLELTVIQGAGQNFGVQAVAPDSMVVEYRWLFDGEPVPSDGSEAFFQLDSLGEHQITAMVTAGADGDTLVWNVNVVPPDAAPGDELRTPTAFAGLTASPNPFNNETHISFNLDREQIIRLEVRDLQGRVVTTLFAGRGARGENRVIWDAAGVPSGVYLIRLEAERGVSYLKTALVR